MKLSTVTEVKKVGKGVAFLLPNIIGFLLFTFIPLITSFVMAFTDWNLQMHNLFQDTKIKFIGVDNFVRLFSDPDFFTYLGNTFFLMLGIPFGMAGSLFAALLLNHDFKEKSGPVFRILILTVIMTVACGMLTLVGMGSSAMMILLCGLAGAVLIGGSVGGQTVYRTLFYFPSFTAGTATYILWKKLYNPESGPINNFLQPILDRILPSVQGMSESSANLSGNVFLVFMLLGFVLTMYRLLHRWSEGECGTFSLWIGVIICCLPVGSLKILCPENLSWGGPVGIILTISAVLTGAFFVVRGRDYSCETDFGLSDAAIINGIFMIGMFALLGLSHVALGLPTAAADGSLKAPKWIVDYYWAKPSLMLMGFWAAIGSNNMLLYLAGLSGVSKELYEAADIDGASSWQRFWNVTWPQLANVTFFIAVMSVMSGLQGGFEMSRVMTQGGPAGATTTLSYYIYNEGFDTGRLGYASAVAWTLFALVFGVTLFNWKFGNRYTND